MTGGNVIAAWLLKTEPDVYSLDDLERDGKTAWDGITNNAALKHLRTMKVGEACFVYHTGKEKRVVGIAKVASAPYAAGDDPKLAVIDLAFDKRLPRPVTLAEIKADPFFAEWELVRQSRLSVVPTPAEVWRKVVRKSELDTDSTD